jgi:hypothetical protein
VEDVPEEWDLQTARAQNDMKLKSIFEGIFSKYGKDFTEVGDEIDLQTGKIVVDNGHLLGLRQETDAGDETPSWLYEGENADSENGDGSEEESVQAHEPSATTNEQDDIHGDSDSDSNDSLLDSALAYNDARNTEDSKQATWKRIEDRGPKDPLWQAPELPRLFSTPTAESRQKVAVTPQLPTFTRARSPPGSGSLWTVPRRGRPRGPRTEGKAKATPSKLCARAKPTYHSSPVAHDWSFSQIPDDDESDDPLQEYQPSPASSRMTSVREKRIPGPAFTLNRYLESRPSTQGAVPRGQSATKTDSHSDSDSDIDSEDDTHGHVALDTPTQRHSSQSQAQITPKPQTYTVPRYKVPEVSHGITLDQGRLITRMRHVQHKKYKEIKDCLPNCRMRQIYTWEYNHWSQPRSNPPQLSAPWTKGEMEILENLADKPGLSWADIKAEVPGRSRREIEYELIRLWVGDEVWNDEQWDGAEGEDVPGVSSRPPKRPLDPGTPEVDPERDDKTSHGSEVFSDDDSDSVRSEASSIFRISAIDFNPTQSRQVSRTPSRASPAKRLKLTT